MSSKHQPLLCAWLCDKIGLTPTRNIQCLGSVRGGRILGVVGFDCYNRASLQMHVAGEPGWLTRDLLRATFHYAFNVCKVNMVIGMVPSGNADAIKFNKALGFNVRDTLEGAHPDGALLLMTMTRGECRFIKESAHGQEVRSTAAA